jgi:hypothetical protein
MTQTTIEASAQGAKGQPVFELEGNAGWRSSASSARSESPD